MEKIWNALEKFWNAIVENLAFLGVCLLGEGLRWLLPLPIPASIYGLALMLLLLVSRLVKLEQVENAADFLIQIMTPMFIPAAVGLMDQFQSLRAILLPFLVINLVGLVVTFAVTGRVTQFFLRREKGAKK